MKKTYLMLVPLLIMVSLAHPLLAQEAGSRIRNYLGIRNYLENSGYETITDSLRIGNTLTVNGKTVIRDSVRIGSNLIVQGSVTFNGSVCGVDSFTTTAQHDTVTITGASLTDKYVVSGRSTAATSNDVLSAEVTSTGIVVHRPASGTSGYKYTWFRFK